MTFSFGPNFKRVDTLADMGFSPRKVESYPAPEAVGASTEPGVVAVTVGEDSKKSLAGTAAKETPPVAIGNTKFVMALLSEMWIFNLLFIIGGTYIMTFIIPQNYVDDEVWNVGCWWKLAWILPLPYTLICFFGLTLPFRTPKYLYTADLPRRRLDNLYILTVTKGDNRDAVMRSWNAHRHLESLHSSVRVHVLTDEPYYFDGINCYTCPKTFTTSNSKYKARALEWYRQTIRYTEHDWVLHLDEESGATFANSVVDTETVRRVLEFIWLLAFVISGTSTITIGDKASFCTTNIATGPTGFSLWPMLFVSATTCLASSFSTL